MMINYSALLYGVLSKTPSSSDLFSSLPCQLSNNWIIHPFSLLVLACKGVASRSVYMVKCKSIKELMARAGPFAIQTLLYCGSISQAVQANVVVG
jgi:hypothetical protein